ncbi:CopG family transcriptional regulator [Mesorhizobium sp.]|uniref:ribbon-helix-helix domain-containing protein n=1 Tax=Mesorhizobium sp. TaxID=1871066 RepID=UPI0012197157|nr:CopG family transcriptional regulator [Mesorhizobium sp.]TIS88440.1 MAG: ribbon-helix-helix protein, CopG family [Mesorhizobium sp.]
MPFSRSAESVERPAHRLSVSLNEEQYAQIADLARRNRVSIAWVVREALERMLTESQPLLRQRRRQP